LHSSGSKFTGKYLGVATGDEILAGKWEGVLLAGKTDKKTKDRIINQTLEKWSQD